MLASLKVITPEYIEKMTNSMGYDADWELIPKAAKKAKRPQSTPALADELVVETWIPCSQWPGAAQGSAGPALAMPALQQADLGGQAQGAEALQQAAPAGQAPQAEGVAAALQAQPALQQADLGGQAAPTGQDPQGQGVAAALPALQQAALGGQVQEAAGALAACMLQTLYMYGITWYISCDR